jgi:hypothetical protein
MFSAVSGAVIEAAKTDQRLNGVGHEPGDVDLRCLLGRLDPVKQRLRALRSPPE